MEVKFNCCKYLDHDEANYHGCKLRIQSFHGTPMFPYFERGDMYNHDEVRKNVQFCKRRGRLNEKSACIEGYNVCSDYENEERIVTIEE